MSNEQNLTPENEPAMIDEGELKDVNGGYRGYDPSIIHYRTVKGDTLSRIACRYGVTIEQLRRDNTFLTDPVFVPAGIILTIHK